MNTRRPQYRKASQPHPQDLYSQLILQWRKRRWIAVILSILIFSALSSLCVQGHLKPLWITFSLLSLTLGYWTFSLSHLIAWILFLQPRIKNQHARCINEYPVYNARKKVQHTLIKLVLSTGFLAFSLALLYLQQPNNDGTVDALQWGDLVALVVFDIAVSLAAFILTSQFLTFLFGRALFLSSFKSYWLSGQPDYSNTDSLSPIKNGAAEDVPMHSASQAAWKNWDENPENPASVAFHIKSHHHRDDSY